VRFDFFSGKYISWGFGEVFDEYFGMVDDQVDDCADSMFTFCRANPMVWGLNSTPMAVCTMGLG
jgi:hypothetical protein